MTDDTPRGGEIPVKITTRVGPISVLPVWVLTYPLTLAELKAYISIRSYADVEGDCYPTTRRIADRAGIELKTARAAVQRLRDLKIMETVPRYRADGSFGGWDYHLPTVDPRLTDPMAGTAERKSKKRKTAPVDEGGTPPGAPDTDMDKIPQTEGGYPARGTRHEPGQNGTDSDESGYPARGTPLPRAGYPPTPPGVPIELTRELTNELTTSSSCPGQTNTADAPPTDNREEEDSKIITDDARDALRRATTGVPAHRMPNRDQAGQLVTLAVDVLRSGWRPVDLARYLGDGDLTTAQSVYAVLRHRLQNVPDAPASRAPSTTSRSVSDERDWRQTRTSTSASVAARERARLVAAGRTRAGNGSDRPAGEPETLDVLVSMLS
jgi:hypothetical protein